MSRLSGHFIVADLLTLNQCCKSFQQYAITIINKIKELLESCKGATKRCKFSSSNFAKCDMCKRVTIEVVTYKVYNFDKNFQNVW